ncbi:Histidine kinase-like ATPase domain protein [Brevinematales bacterium NS]|nr:ATP-binding protein [Brevinematales bacterium]QJR20755.1 Histidine kinase-like ATPase domain protein [Brevinematales bacterium NS]
MNHRRRFPLTVKDELLDFTLTRNVWFTLNNQNGPFYRFARSFDKYSLRVGIDLWDNPFYDYEALPEHLPDVLTYHEGVVKVARRKKVYYYVGTCDVPFRPVDIDHSFRVNEGEILLALDQPLERELLISRPKKECELVADEALSFLQRYFRRNFRGVSLLYVMQFLPAEKYTFFIQSSLGAVGLTTEMFKNKLLGYQCDEHWHIETVIHEALVNAITYGSQMDYSKKISIAYEIGPEALRVFIQDPGEGFDVRRHVPVSLIDNETITGRGIRLMKHLTSALTYNANGNALSLLFNFRENYT